MAPSKIQLKLLVDDKKGKVLFAEAGKDFVDFLFSLLTLPIAAVAKRISMAVTMHGSVGRLYKSVDDMAATYLLPSADKSDLLQPRAPPPAGRDLLEQLLARFKLYTCPRRCMTVTVNNWAECPQCKHPMTAAMSYALPSAAPAPKSVVGAPGPSAAASDESGGGGYVKGLVTYMVTDGLEVTPMTSSITLIKRFSARKDVDLVEKFVTVGMDEGLDLMQAALRSDTVLSDTFLWDWISY